ncbi:MAG: CDP-diacylglycerol--glycerol-3-phosphate 3-phosphatidyltransferase [Acutalibacteraceae bacterium]|nr:CDP-diacylglycerol--glycerol-3-phosphate 3-phosphatidyltransferase [Acutalibacteraceae bacterium]
MNTPNKLTLARMIATPIFMAVMLIDFKFHYLISLVLFIAASLTDMIDGKMARKYNMVTDFGKFMDPLADKMLTTSAYLGFMFIYGGTKFAWHIVVITFIVLFREFAVSSIRLVAVTAGGKVVAANMWGKCKTVSQMAGIILALAVYALNELVAVSSNVFAVLDIVIIALFWFSALLCVISGAIYIYGGRQYIANAK